MVAVEAAACGALPLSASHSGLAEVTRQLEEAVDERVRPLLSFERGPGAVEEIARKLAEWLAIDPDDARERRARRCPEEARARFGWERVAQGVIAAAEGAPRRSFRGRARSPGRGSAGRGGLDRGG